MTEAGSLAKRVAITGAGSGLGQALAERYARAGWRVAVTDIVAERAETVAAALRADGSEAFAQTLDIRRAADFTALTTRLETEWGGVDCFINNAGVAAAGTLVDTPPDDWDWLVDINLGGVVRGSRAALPLLRASHGHLVNIASFAAVANAPGMAAYNVAKAGVLSLSESIRGEERPRGVSVTVACPAFFATGLMDNFRSTEPDQKALVTRLMARSRIGAADIANDIYEAAAAGRFLVISHREARWQYRFKRLAPETFFRAVVRTTRAFTRRDTTRDTP